MLSLLTNLEADSAKGGLMKEKDLSQEQLDTIQRFYTTSFTFPYLLDFFDTLHQCTDLSPLWYKEFHLELAREIQVRGRAC